MSFFSELRRRNVFRVAGSYAVVAWLLIQVASAVSTPLNLPGWFEAVIIVLLAIGFPVALVLAWAFEMTPDGPKLTQPQERESPSGGSRLDYALIGALALLAAIAVWDHFPSRTLDSPPDSSQWMDHPSIAVLPFTDMSPGGDQEYFGDGIAEELLNALSRLDGLRVAGRTSSFAYKERADDLRKIGQALNVTTILEGSVRKDGERIRITAQLINAADGYHLWSQVFDRNLNYIFSIQEEIATEVAGALGVRLGVGNVNAFIGAGTKNVEAYEAYLKGWTIWDTRGESIRYLETATQLDPNYAAAWSALGVHTASLQWTANPEDAPAILNRAYQQVRRAVELDPTSGQSVLLLGTILYAQFDWIGGEKAHEKAISLHADRTAHEQHGNLLMRAGRLGSADVQFDAAVAAEPLVGSTTNFAWQVSLGQGRLDEAKRRMMALDPRGIPIEDELTLALHEGNREVIKALLADMQPMAVRTSALYAPVLRDFDSPEKALDTLRAVYANDDARWPSKLNDISFLAAYFGDAELALQAIGEESRYTAIRLQTLWYPLMSEVRRLPGFKDLVRDINLVDYWRAYGWADTCQPLVADEFHCE